MCNNDNSNEKDENKINRNNIRKPNNEDQLIEENI